MTPHHESGRVSEPDGALKSGLRYLLCMGRLHMLHKSVDVSLRDAKVLVRSQLEAPPTYRTTNCRNYNVSLRKRGSLLILLAS